MRALSLWDDLEAVARFSDFFRWRVDCSEEELKTAAVVVYEERKNRKSMKINMRKWASAEAKVGVVMQEYCGASPVATCADSSAYRYEVEVDGELRGCGWANTTALCRTKVMVKASDACAVCGVVEADVPSWRIHKGNLEAQVCEWVEKDHTNRCAKTGVVTATRACPVECDARCASTARSGGGGGGGAAVESDVEPPRELRGSPKYFGRPTAAMYRKPWELGSSVLWVPLSRTNEFAKVERNAIARRDFGNVTFEYLFNMVVSLNTDHAIRKPWDEEAKAFQKRLEARGVRAFIHNTDRWKGKSPEKVTTHVSVKEWYHVARASAFTISPPGHSWETFRLWEAASVGSIPVVLRVGAGGDGRVSSSQECALGAQAPFSSAPFLWVDTQPGGRASLRGAFDEILRLASDPRRLAARRRAVKAWYDHVLKTTMRRLEALAAGAVGRARGETGAMPLITGAGHSGTRALADLLAKNGVKTLHERTTPYAVTSSWFHAAWRVPPKERPGLPFKFRTWPEKGFAASVHVVRDPLNHIRALAAGFSGLGALDNIRARGWDKKSFDFAAYISERVKAAYERAGSGDGQLWRGVGASKWDDDRLKLAALYYLDWNALAANAAPLMRVKVEDVDEYALFAALGVETQTTWPLNHTFAALAASGHKSSSHKITLTWGPRLRAALGDDLYGELLRRARAYGYDAHDPSHDATWRDPFA